MIYKNGFLGYGMILVFILFYGCGNKSKDINFKEINSLKINFHHEIFPIKLLKHNNKYIVADDVSHSIYLIDQKGNILSKIGKEGKAPGEFLRIVDMAINKNNILCVSDEINRKVALYHLKNDSLYYLKDIKVRFLPSLCAITDDNQVFYTCLDIINKEKIVIVKKYDINTDKHSTYLSKKLTSKMRNHINNLGCAIKIKNNHMFLDYIFTGVIEKYVMSNRPVMKKSFFVGFSDKKKRLGFFYVKKNYIIQTYNLKKVKNTFKVFGLDGEYLGAAVINEKEKVWALNFSEDFQLMFYLLGNTLHILKRVTLLPYE